MTAGIYDITIEQGATFTLSATWKDSAGAPVNLTGYSARMQVRSNYESEEVLVSLVSPTNITLGGALGTILATISATDTQKLSIQEGVYDLELELSGVVTRLLQGRATISREVTR
jgi:hypothetical protein